MNSERGGGKGDFERRSPWSGWCDRGTSRCCSRCAKLGLLWNPPPKQPKYDSPKHSWLYIRTHMAASLLLILKDTALLLIEDGGVWCGLVSVTQNGALSMACYPLRLLRPLAQLIELLGRTCWIGSLPYMELSHSDPTLVMVLSPRWRVLFQWSAFNWHQYRNMLPCFCERPLQSRRQDGVWFHSTRHKAFKLDH